MRIYEMTATFGKLEHETLKLQPGMNIIHAPNEWGKSTWCAFLVAMLYGMDTRAKTTKTALADKERYAPWSGSPMSGRIDLNWNGRDITIERKTKRRVPLGDFRAYETETGLEIPELTAANCGQMLLGVEQSVFRRAGFIRLSDLPVTQDDALRRRLNALVTTGDESGDGERLARDLKDLRNRCRYNRSGLLPQAEAEREELENKLSELEALEAQSFRLKQRLGEIKSWLRQLENHQDALVFAAAEADAGRVAEARDAHDRAVHNLETLEITGAALPAREKAEKKVYQLREFQENWNSLQMELRLLPAQPEAPVVGELYRGLTTEQAEEMVGRDVQRYELLQRTKPHLALMLPGGALGLLATVLLVMQEFWIGGIGLALGLILLLLGMKKRKAWRTEAAALEEKYGSADADVWMENLRAHLDALKAYEQACAEHRKQTGDLDVRLALLDKQRAALCGQQSPEKVLALWQDVLRQWEARENAHREVRRTESYLRAMESMAKTAKAPAMPDDLTYTEAETARLLSDALQEQQRLQNRLGQYQGRMEVLGNPAALQQQLAQVNGRIEKLENTYSALTIALDTLAQAKMELQRRFAPRIANRAQELLGAMTGGRYDRLTLAEDLSIHAGAAQEDTLHEALWRSDGTVDQLYLALRLAVAEELTPEAPLILDDALVRFDEDRMKAALEILKKESDTKQVILFSCQKREQEAM